MFRTISIHIVDSSSYVQFSFSNRNLNVSNVSSRNMLYLPANIYATDDRYGWVPRVRVCIGRAIHLLRG